MTNRPRRLVNGVFVNQSTRNPIGRSDEDRLKNDRPWNLQLEMLSKYGNGSFHVLMQQKQKNELWECNFKLNSLNYEFKKLVFYSRSNQMLYIKIENVS